MSFNEDELIKIKTVISGWLKKSTRKAVSNSLSEIKIKVDSIKGITNCDDRKKAFIRLMNQATATRQVALTKGLVHMAINNGQLQLLVRAGYKNW